MGMRWFLGTLMMLGLFPAVSASATPASDDWHGASWIASFPFEAQVDLSAASRDTALLPDCMPDERWPQSLVDGAYADVWYRIGVTEPTRLIAIGELAGGSPIIGIYQALDADRLHRRHCDYDQEPGEPASVGFWVYPGVPVLVQLGACVTCGHATEVRFELLEPDEADLAVHSLTVTRPTTSTPVGELPQPTARDAAFVLENNSAEGPAIRGLWRLKACHEHDPGTEYCIPIDRGVASLAPGEQLSLTSRWDAIGSAGDFTICASVTPFDFVDTNYANNKVTQRTWVLVSNVQGESYPNYLAGDFWGCNFRSYY